MDQITVSELTQFVKLLLETTDPLRNLWVAGELSNVTINSFSGHMYFTLKDEQSSVRAVCFRRDADRLRFVPKDGMAVLTHGRATLYPRDGQFQLIVDDIIPEGIGKQNKFLSALKKKLEAEGLFSPERKRPIPRFPSTIALLTAPNSAALADIKKVLSLRNPLVHLVVFPVSVQGLLAEESIVSTLSLLQDKAAYDLAIIARGGGSTEDLYTFNSEKVVRAAASLPMPFISAVGHETDFSLLDFAADLRASTPTQAAEFAVGPVSEIENQLMDLFLRASNLLTLAIGEKRMRLRTAISSSEQLIDGLQTLRLEQWTHLQSALTDGMEKSLSHKKARLAASAAAVSHLSPYAVLARGYTFTERDGVPIGSIRQMTIGETFTVRFHDGKLLGRTLEIEEGQM